MIYFMLYLWLIIDPILVIFGHYSLFLVYFVANYRPHLSHLANDILNLKVSKNCDPMLVTLWKMPELKATHYSQSSRENATPPSGTSPVVTKLFGAPDFNGSC